MISRRPFRKLLTMGEIMLRREYGDGRYDPGVSGIGNFSTAHEESLGPISVKSVGSLRLKTTSFDVKTILPSVVFDTFFFRNF
jgi:hypothetical protein